MDKRYSCGDCGLKWFVQAGRVDVPEPTTCASCGGDLQPLVAAAPVDLREPAQA